MTYVTPELLLVGAAQSLVLGSTVSSLDCERNTKDLPQSDEIELW